MFGLEEQLLQINGAAGIRDPTTHGGSPDSNGIGLVDCQEQIKHNRYPTAAEPKYRRLSVCIWPQAEQPTSGWAWRLVPSLDEVAALERRLVVIGTLL